MSDREMRLFRIIEHILMVRNECSCKIFSECGVPDLTVRQIAYLRTIDEQGEVTFSRLAEITRNSKPTITEMVNKFVRMECVYRDPCPHDRRVLYIRLTDKGQKIARAEHHALCQAIERMMDSLDDREQDLLIDLLNKIH